MLKLTNFIYFCQQLPFLILTFHTSWERSNKRLGMSIPDWTIPLVNRFIRTRDSTIIEYKINIPSFSQVRTVSGSANSPAVHEHHTSMCNCKTSLAHKIIKRFVKRHCQ